MKKIKAWKKIAAIMGVLTLTAGLAGCGGGGSNDNEVNIGYFNNVTHAQALYMKANSTLEEAFGEDMSVAWTAFNAGPAEVEALFAGDIDIGYIGPVPAISATPVPPRQAPSLSKRRAPTSSQWQTLTARPWQCRRLAIPSISAS